MTEPTDPKADELSEKLYDFAMRYIDDNDLRWDELALPLIREALAEARTAERERCIAICEQHHQNLAAFAAQQTNKLTRGRRMGEATAAYECAEMLRQLPPLPPAEERDG